MHIGVSDLRDMLCSLLLESPDTNNWSAGNIEREVRELMWKAEWFQVYDFIEIIAQRLGHNGTGFLRQFEDKLNDAFRRKGVGWQLVDGHIEIRGEESFEKSVRTAIEVTEATGRNVAQHELHQALQDLSKRPSPDITGAIQHAMAALECVAKDVTGDSKLTLGEWVKKNPTKFPQPLGSAVEKLWGYASQFGRHVQEGKPADYDEAEMVVGICASLSTYLIKKGNAEKN
jgi:hypothetical protein